MYTCPNGCDLRGEPIPEASQDLFGGATYFSRMVGIELRGGYDGVVAWFCPDCNLTWPRPGWADDPHVLAYLETLTAQTTS